MVTALLLLSGLATGAPDDATVRAALARVYGAERYQQDLPASPQPVTPVTRQATAGSAPQRPPRRPAPDAGAPRPLPAPLAPAVSQALWLGCLLVLVVVAAWLLLRRRSGALPASAAPAASPRAGASRPTPAEAQDAERLAAEGRFGEAIHALLLRALARLSGGRGLAPALTGREVLASAALGPRQREALEPLVLESERVHFARQPATAEDYARCQDHARRLSPGGPA
jgi:hypothetical protein